MWGFIALYTLTLKFTFPFSIDHWYKNKDSVTACFDKKPAFGFDFKPDHRQLASR